MNSTITSPATGSKSGEDGTGGVLPWRIPAVWGWASLGLGLAALLVGTAPAFVAPAIQTGMASALGVLAGVGLMGLAWALGSRTRTGDPAADLIVAAAEGAQEAILITDAEGAAVYANAAFRRVFAWDGDVRGTGPRPVDAVAAVLDGGEEAADRFARLCAAAAAGLGGEDEFAMTGAAGAVEWRRLSAVPLAGRRGYALWRAVDVTARRELEATRHEEEQFLADLLDHLPAGFFSADAGGRILYANQTLAGLLGTSAAEMRSRQLGLADFVVDSGSSAADADGAFAPDGEVTLRKRDGTTFRASIVGSERRDEAGQLLYSRAVVMAEPAWRQRAAANASEDRLHWLFDEAPVGIVLLDLRGTLTDCNRAFLMLLGLKREDVVGQPFSQRVSREDGDEVGAQLSKVVMGTMRAAHMEVRMPGGGERELVTSLYASRMEDDAGEVSGLILHFIDTTEHKNLEIQFAQSQKMQAVGQLAGGVAHDFNNLLTAMIGFSDLLLDRHRPGDPSFADIMQIKQNANRATNLVRQLLAFSRQQTLQPDIHNPTDLLSDLSNLLGRLIDENVTLDMKHGRDLGLVRVDRGQFDQVVINLAVNGRDAMPGGGTLTITSSNVTIDTPVQRGHDLMPAGDYVLITVADTGSGIRREDIGHIFEPFFSTKEVGAGTGLGLSTVYGIIRQTDGFIFVDSAPGKGSTFSIYLPLYEEQAADSAKAAPPRGDAAPPVTADDADLTGVGTVLLVEDEDAVRMFGARALRNKGYQVLEAENGEGALDVINSTAGPIDLIISDVVMPGMDGHTLVRLVREELPNVKIILMSGYAEGVFVEEIQRDETIHFLPKPFTLKDLAGKVKEVVEGG